MTTLEQLLDLLNKDLSLEYQAAAQYVQHYGVVTGAQYMTIRSALGEHATEELGHALKLSDAIQYYGGIPVATGPVPSLAKEVPKMLLLDLTSEEMAIGRYRTRVKQVEEMGYYELSQLLRDILGEEMDHANELKLALGR